jgi:hypothetical protein
MLKAVESVFLVGMNDDFRIGICAKNVSERFQGSPKFWKVIDFSVKNNPDAFIFVTKGLFAGYKVNDCQPSVPESDILVNIKAFTIRSPMGKDSVHPV